MCESNTRLCFEVQAKMPEQWKKSLLSHIAVDKTSWQPASGEEQKKQEQPGSSVCRLPLSIITLTMFSYSQSHNFQARLHILLFSDNQKRIKKQFRKRRVKSSDKNLMGY